MPVSSDPILAIGANPAETLENTARWIKSVADAAVAERGLFSWALPGGSTPRALFSLLASPAWLNRLPWRDTVLFWGDERDVPPTHRDSNYGMAQHTLISRLPVPPKGLCRWQTESTPPVALAAYRRDLARLPHPDGVPQLDLVLLGLGPDGHTASLFPGTSALESEDWVAHLYVPSQRQWRYTLTLPVLNQAGAVGFLTVGPDKAPAVRAVLNPDPKDPILPAQRVRPKSPVHWFLDTGSAGSMPVPR